jgi:hypothetical protein
VIRYATEAEREPWRREREQREAVNAASSSKLSHGLSRRTAPAADANEGSNSSHSEGSR